MKIKEIEKKKCLFLLNKKIILKIFFNNIKLILTNYLSEKLMYFYLYRDIY